LILRQKQIYTGQLTNQCETLEPADMLKLTITRGIHVYNDGSHKNERYITDTKYTLQCLVVC